MIVIQVSARAIWSTASKIIPGQEGWVDNRPITQLELTVTTALTTNNVATLVSTRRENESRIKKEVLRGPDMSADRPAASQSGMSQSTGRELTLTLDEPGAYYSSSVQLFEKRSSWAQLFERWQLLELEPSSGESELSYPAPGSRW